MRRGFTLVEMLAATALSAVLLVTMLAVIASLGRERRAAAATNRAEVPPGVVELIRWDLVNARELNGEAGRVTLSGYGALDPDALAPLGHRPIEVVYEVRRAAGRSWLVRRQRAGQDEDLSSDELVCADVADLLITPLEATDELATAVAAAQPTSRPATLPTTRPEPQPSMAACVRLQIRWDAPNRAPLDRILVLR
jgi:prepilin-type N-terminal cleavage/methylation domain-containing protein